MVFDFYFDGVTVKTDNKQLSTITGSLCVVVGLLLTKRNHYFNDSIESNAFFLLLIVTLKVGDSAPLTVFKMKMLNVMCYILWLFQLSLRELHDVFKSS